MSDDVDLEVEEGGAVGRGDLSAREVLFCEYLVNGMSQAEAYRRAGWVTSSPASAAAAASRKVRDPRVQAHVHRLRVGLADELALSRQEKRALLAQIVRGEVWDAEVGGMVPVSLGMRMQALQVDNAMTGDNAAVTVDAGGSLMDALFALVPDQRINPSAGEEVAGDEGC